MKTIEMSHFTLKVPDSLLDRVRRLAEQDHTSLNQFIVAAIAEKVSALETARFLAERGQKADWSAYSHALASAADHPARADDELPPHD